MQRAFTVTQRQKAAAAALVRARAKVAAALAQARTVAAERVAREHARQGLLSRAQSDPKAVGRLLAADRGWGGQQFDCLSSLWTKESGWRWNANNSSSGAYGIPQSLPGSKMASFGSDWATNPITQIKWGLQYISNSYGTPCSAWAQSQALELVLSSAGGVGASHREHVQRFVELGLGQVARIDVASGDDDVADGPSFEQGLP